MLSVFRLILIGVFIALFKNERYLLSFFVYIFAFGTDILDGWLARRNNWITNVGKVLDPLADKLLGMLHTTACVERQADADCRSRMFLVQRGHSALYNADNPC